MFKQMMLFLGSMNKNTNKLIILAVFLGLAFSASVQAADVSMSLRYQDTVVLDAVSFELPSPGTITITDTSGVDRSVNAQSVLGILAALDSADASFALSKIQYFSSFDSLYFQCATIISLGGEQCDNWLYIVNGVDPLVGMDTSILTGGEQVYVFFGPDNQVVLSTITISKGAPFQATAQSYQYEDNTWGQLTGVTIGFTQPDPDNPFSPIEVLLQSVDELGQISLNLDISVGDYSVGIKEKFYFPSAQLTVVVPPTGQSGGGLPQHVHQSLDKEKAIQFLIANQNDDGSFGKGALFTDWTAIAFGAYGKESLAGEKIRDYLLEDISPGSFLTDYERRAMALMSLGINPYTGTKTNYIQKITDGFDGIQFGNPNLVNDDIFALLVLLHAGYEASEDIIAKTVTFVLSSQQESGSFGSVDMTAAAVQVLFLVSTKEGISSALLSAKEYLKIQQENTGGFGNLYSTSWVMQAMAVLGESNTSWVRNNNTSGDYLYSEQAEDGGVEELDTNMDNRIWATAYAIPASLQKSWGDILQDFKQPAVLAVATGEIQELKQHESNALKVEIEVVESKIAKMQVQLLAALKLERIEQEVSRIAIEVRELEPQIVSLHTAYLAQLEQTQDKVLVQQSDDEVAQLSVLEDGGLILEAGTISLTQEAGDQFTAEAASLLSLQSFFRSSTGQAALALGVGIIFFFVLGGGGAILSLVRRPKATI